MKKKFILALLLSLVLNSFLILAHCPLCTVGIAAAAGGAAYLGVDKAVIALFVGAFAVSTGWWIGRKIKRKVIPHQTALLAVASFLLTVLPLLSLLYRIYPLYISWGGDYGTLFNRTYVVNLSLLTSIFGGILAGSTPWLSNKISHRRGKTIPYQGILLTFGLLIMAGVLIQVI